MINFYSLCIIYFAIIGYIKGFEFTWYLFKDDVYWMYKVIPSIGNGLIFSALYLSIPLFSFLFFDTLRIFW